MTRCLYMYVNIILFKSECTALVLQYMFCIFASSSFNLLIYPARDFLLSVRYRKLYISDVVIRD